MVSNNNDKRLIQMVAINKIREPQYVARHLLDKDDMQELMDSIEQHGLIQPIRLRPVNGGYEIVAGHRRFLAHKKLRRKEIAAEVVATSDLNSELVKMAENMVRVDLTDVEEAHFFERLKKMGNLTLKKVAKLVNRSESYVQQKLAILSYPDYLYNAIVNGQITFSAARELVRVIDVDVLRDYVSHAIRSGITPALARQWADDWLAMQRHVAQDEVVKTADAGDVGGSKIQLPCVICAQYHAPEDTVMIRLCKSDYNLIINQLRNSNKEVT